MRSVGKHLRANVVAYIALFFAVGMGTAWAAGLTKNSVKSGHIVNGQVKSVDVQNNGLTGADISEGTLGQVPSAAAAVAAQDADTLDGKDSGDFLGANAGAGGDLSGSYPNPAIADGAVTAGKIGTLPAVRVWDGYQAWNGTGCASGVANNSEQPICFAPERYDTDNMHDPSAGEPRTKLTAPRAGLYSVTAGMIWTSTSDTGSRQLNIKKNGGEYVAAEQIPAGPAGNNTIHNVTGTVRLNQGDFVQAFAWQNSGGNLGIFGGVDSRSFFEMHWIGP